MVKVVIRLLVLATVLSVLAFAPWTVRAQNALQPTQILVGASAPSGVGSLVTVQALLVDGQGHPISKEVVYFTTQSTFLHHTSDVVLAQAVTNSNGQAVAHFTDDFSEPLTISAEFRGDAQYAASTATLGAGMVTGGQVYVDHIGVDLPGFNVPPVVAAPRAGIGSSDQGLAGFVQSLWPAMNGWPVAAVLLLVWSMYLFAVRFVFRLAALGDEPGDSPSADSRRSL